MTNELAGQIWVVIGGYLAIGFLFALIFVFGLIGMMDPAARGIKFWVRMTILPGVALLWPLMLLNTVLRKGPPVQ